MTFSSLYIVSLAKGSVNIEASLVLAAHQKLHASKVSIKKKFILTYDAHRMGIDDNGTA